MEKEFSEVRTKGETLQKENKELGDKIEQLQKALEGKNSEGKKENRISNQLLREVSEGQDKLSRAKSELEETKATLLSMTMAVKRGEEIIAVMEDQQRIAELELEELKGEKSKGKKTRKEQLERKREKETQEGEARNEIEEVEVMEEGITQLEERIFKKLEQKMYKLLDIDQESDSGVRPRGREPYELRKHEYPKRGSTTEQKQTPSETNKKQTKNKRR
ncbi:PREDICTED: protein Daple-like [Priapulus caudatus]|uniref:Protein Daple-like n=1 Tax=Priapulus caudatus TaxID=37621 RepID=A0ABM1ENI8_PRICU|nr:PREDICTED: protein Daple-like [Priapulus caudatus]